jgi:hypothetical protein
LSAHWKTAYVADADIAPGELAEFADPVRPDPAAVVGREIVNSPQVSALLANSRAVWRFVDPIQGSVSFADSKVIFDSTDLSADSYRFGVNYYFDDGRAVLASYIVKVSALEDNVDPGNDPKDEPKDEPADEPKDEPADEPTHVADDSKGDDAPLAPTGGSLDTGANALPVMLLLLVLAGGCLIIRVR